ncbi:hypothetical protein DNTS_034772 [Danionella cerebrum]|uniref:non-specific serine/threonine protein kinase n=1 Tax=Danionella cerebrum TaxID=2873325 RepID=A0A553MXU3_9TELE|nr:hypothetical protein DNTS_034772 [Danionella translucida]
MPAVAAGERRGQKNKDEAIIDHYKPIKPLGAGGFGFVFKVTRVADGLKVAVKEVMKTKDLEYITIPDHPTPLPTEIALTIMANKGPRTPGNLASFLDSHNGELPAKVVRHIMRQATQAVETCWQRQVFHGDIKLENFLFYKETL